jgi:hypothetical protein
MVLAVHQVLQEAQVQVEAQVLQVLQEVVELAVLQEVPVHQVAQVQVHQEQAD